MSFTFDDFPRSAYVEGGAVLESLGVRGTYYAAPGLMGSSNELGPHFTAGDIYSLLDKGHELATHTYSHTSCRSVSTSEFRDDVTKGIREIESLTRRKVRNFAYPLGHVTLATKQALAPFVTSARSVIPGLNGPECDLNLLRANSLYGDDRQIEHVRQLIKTNAKRKSWLVFYTHDVQRNPSVFGCTPSLLRAAVQAAVESSSKVLSVHEALANNGVMGRLSNDRVSLTVPA